MRIVVGSLQQESNTLTSRASTRDDFTVHEGPAMLGRIAVTPLLESRGIDIVPTLHAGAVPGGPLREADFRDLARELVGRIPDAPLDGIWLHLHGALEVENLGSGEAALLAMVREKVGCRVPIAVALDFHANNAPELMRLANLVVGYRTAPHRDIEETELRAARLLLHCIERRLLPRPQMARADVVVPGDCVVTDEQPLRGIMAEAAALEREPGMLSCSVFNGQPWVDAPTMGPSMVCVHERDEAAAKAAARRLARLFWDARREFRFAIEACEPEEALDRAWAERRRPVFVTDSGDNTTAGSAGDNAFVLKMLQQKGMRNVLVGGITDAPAVRACYAAAPGSILDLGIGGTIEPGSTRTRVRGTLLHRGDIEGWQGENAGPSAVLRCEGIDVVVTARRTAFTRPSIFEGLGLKPADYRFVVVKLGYLFPELSRIAARTILAFTRGASTERLQDMGMVRIRRPVFPLDDGFEPTFE